MTVTAVSAPARIDVARTTAVVGLLVTAAVHVPVATEHVGAARYLLVSFDVLVLLTAALAASLGARVTRTAALFALLVCAAAIAAYLVSRTVGLPLEGDDIGDWSSTLGIVSLVAETAVVVSAARLLRRHG